MMCFIADHRLFSSNVRHRRPRIIALPIRAGDIFPITAARGLTAINPRLNRETAICNHNQSIEAAKGTI